MMPSYLIDENLPRLQCWSTPDFFFTDTGGGEQCWSDSQLWDRALSDGLTIITKDADFGNRLLLARVAPPVVHIRLGNLRLAEFSSHIEGRWVRIAALSAKYRLVNVYRNRIEPIV